MCKKEMGYIMIQLRLIENYDFENVYEYSSNAKVAKYLTWDQYNSREEFTPFFFKMLHSRAIDNEFLSILDNDLFLGTAHIIRRENSWYQFGFGVLPQYWGKRHGEKILHCIENIIDESVPETQYGLRAECHIDNVPIQKILNNNGYIMEKIVNHRARYRKMK